MLASFSIEGKVLLETKQLKLDKRKSTNISEVYLITLLSMSVSWLTFNISNLAICFRISSYLLAKKQKKFLSLWYEYSEYVRMISVFQNNRIIDVTHNSITFVILDNIAMLLYWNIHFLYWKKFPHFQSKLFFHEMLFCHTKMVLQFSKTFYCR